MKTRVLLVLFVSLAVAAYAQNPGSAPPASQNTGNGAGGDGQRGGRGFGSGMSMGIGGGRGLIGTVTEVAADHYNVKTDTGEIYTVHFSVNTRIMKELAGQRGQGRPGQERGAGQGAGGGVGNGDGPGRGGTPPESIKPTDIKVGDAIAAMGEVDPAAKSVGAIAILQLDPERAKQMKEMQANYGKTWIMGKVTAIDDVKVTLLGSVDNAVHVFVADENTTFRKRRDPITLADIQVGDMVRAEGSIKDGAFTATAVNVMGMPPGGSPNVPRNSSPQ
jgi:hypothetical protein